MSYLAKMDQEVDPDEDQEIFFRKPEESTKHVPVADPRIWYLKLVS